VLNVLATLVNICALALIIAEWDAVLKCTCTCKTLTGDECQAALARRRRIIGAWFWTTWVFVLFCAVLCAYTVRALLQVKRAMVEATAAKAQGTNKLPPL
jgi:hypothetical protein